jgi:ferric-dicitrate binding protein FerR (iron transport regulator)
METDNTYYIDLITRYLAGEAGNEEVILLNEWLKSDVKNQEIFDEYRKTWLVVEKQKIENTIDIDNEWISFKSKIIDKQNDNNKVIDFIPESNRSNSLYMRVLKYAAIAALIAFSSVLVYKFATKPSDKIIIAQNNSVETTLSDGTKITLNSNSTIRFPEKFASSERTVKLDGEAYFEVTHDEKKPFIISADDIRIAVLGTSFYVNTNAENNNVVVILTEGKVAVYYSSRPSEKIIMSPGEKVEVSKSSNKIAKAANEDDNYIAWKTKKMIFNNTSLGEIVKSINKVYNSNIVIIDKKLDNCRLTATFENQSLDAVLNVLKETLDLNIIKSGSTVELSGNGCK